MLCRYTGWAVALLTRCPAIFFYGSGFAASLLQVTLSLQQFGFVVEGMIAWTGSRT
jgi:hypothetical protein